MARLIKGVSYREYMEMASHVRGDWSLTERSMRAYLQYRINVLDAQINHLTSRLEYWEEDPFAAPLSEQMPPVSDEAWESWASLNYLLNARDALQQALDRLERGRV